MMPTYSQKDSASIQCREFSISAITEGLHYKCAVIPSQWLKYEEKECKVELLLNHIYEITVFVQVCEHFKMCAHGLVRRSTVASGWQVDITPNLLIAHLWKIAPPPIVLHELKCVLCSNILSQPHGTCMQSTCLHEVHS